MSDQYEYDVAFSFLAADEQLALQLNDLLQDRLTTFLYSKRQEEVAGTDGEKTFSEVFGKKARLVVVLYRIGWGTTSWTRIEETAIRNRAYEHGYDFVKFIPLDDSRTVPMWLPRAQLWLGIDRWGIPAAAAVIEARCQELGGDVREESVAERAARLERSLQFEAKKKDFRCSERGVKAANDEFGRLKALLEREIAAIKQGVSSMSLSLKDESRHIAVRGLCHIVLSINWHYQYTNDLGESVLEVALWDRHPLIRSVIGFEKPRKLQTIRFDVELSPADEPCWVSRESDSRSFSTEQLARFVLKLYMDGASQLAERR